MQLESLANELLLDLFEFINGDHLLRAFSGLNSRFDSLLFTQFRSFSFDFRSVSKTDFDLVCQQHLPLIVDRITSLCLSDHDDTPHQTSCFLSHHLTLGQFIHLQSLSLSHIDSRQTMDQMMNELYRLSHLRHLSIIHCSFQSSYVDSIWRLPKLIRCELKNIGEIDWSNVPTVESLFLRHFSILNVVHWGFSFWSLLKSTPCLQHLATDRLDDLPSEQPTLMIPSIETLSLTFRRSSHGLENLVAHMPNLSQLTVKTKTSPYVDGYRWEKMITNHLPRLKVFRLLMGFGLENDMDGEKQVNQILDSFRTRFWIDEHQWFVRCHWKLSFRTNFYWLYTLPYAFREFKPSTDMRFKSTCSEDTGYHSCDHVHDLSYFGSLSPDFVRLRFSKLHSLHLRLPIQGNFWSVIPTLDRLISLDVNYCEDTSISFPLQTLLDRAPRLYSLTLNRNSAFRVVNLTSKSIRRLTFELNKTYFNKQTCVALSRSSLGMQCEFLWIEIEDKRNIVYLVNNMKNLRALRFTCKDDRWEREHDFVLSSLFEDELVEWFQRHLPPTCSVSRHTVYPDFITLWIR